MTRTLTKKILKSILDIYLSPVKINSKIKRYAQEVILIDTEAHLSKAIQYLKSNNLIRKNPVIIDIGGANGDATNFFLKAFPLSRVLIFEAIPELAAQLKKKFVNLNVETFALALSDRKGTVTFNVADNLLSSSYKKIWENKQFNTLKTVEVPSLPLDVVMDKFKDILEIDILKLDVQGAELDVLSGARQTLQKTKMLIVEQSVRSNYNGGSLYFEVDELLRLAEFELLDIIITYRKDGLVLNEFDSIYIKNKLVK